MASENHPGDPARHMAQHFTRDYEYENFLKAGMDMADLAEQRLSRRQLRVKWDERRRTLGPPTSQDKRTGKLYVQRRAMTAKRQAKGCAARRSTCLSPSHGTRTTLRSAAGQRSAALGYKLHGFAGRHVQRQRVIVAQAVIANPAVRSEASLEIKCRASRPCAKNKCQTTAESPA